MSLPPDLEDELSSINAIYGPGTLELHNDDTATGSSHPNPTRCLLTAPAPHPLHSTTLLLSFPPNYAQSPLHIEGPHSTDATAPKGAGRAAASRARAALERVQQPGEACVFALLAELEAEAEATAEAEAEMEAEAEDPESTQAADGSQDANGLKSSMHAPTLHARFPLDAFTTSLPLESHKSVFLARAIPVYSMSDVTNASHALGMQDKHVSRATHNIRAWRFRSEAGLAPAGVAASAGAPGGVHQDYDDDGETGAGHKMLEVIMAMGALDVLVIVSRWYGGVKRGPERFRLVGRSARDALVRGGWGEDAEGGGPGGKKDKRKKGRG